MSWKATQRQSPVLNRKHGALSDITENPYTLSDLWPQSAEAAEGASNQAWGKTLVLRAPNGSSFPLHRMK